MTKMNVTCVDWRPLHRNTLQGFAAVKFEELRLTVRDVAIHAKGGERWAQLPAKPQLKDGKAVVDAGGKVQYFPVMDFDNREVRDSFSRAAVAAILAREPNAFGADDRAPPRESRPAFEDEDAPF